MTGFITIIYIVCFIFGVLQIILFFKLWEMTNNVKEITHYIKNYHQSRNTNISENIPFHNHSGINVGDLIVHLKTKNQYRVKSITNNHLFECTNSQTPNGVLFDRSDIELFDTYYK